MAGWTTPRTFVAGEVETASIFNAHLRDNLNAINGFVTKTADQSVTSSAVLVNDTHLFYTIPAAGTYVVDIWLYALSAANAAGDLNVGFSFPTGTFVVGGMGADTAIASGNIQTGQWGASTAPVSGSGFNSYGLATGALTILLHGLLTASAAGTFRLIWAQAVSNASASTLKAGSHMTVKQVA